MKPIKSLHSRDSVSGELSQSLLDYQSLVLHLCVDVDWSDTGQKSGKESIIGMGECAAEQSLCLLTTPVLPLHKEHIWFQHLPLRSKKCLLLQVRGKALLDLRDPS